MFTKAVAGVVLVGFGVHLVRVEDAEGHIEESPRTESRYAYDGVRPMNTANFNTGDTLASDRATAMEMLRLIASWYRG
jgi:hypothetical protein